jgi:hypothetical protein
VKTPDKLLMMTEKKYYRYRLTFNFSRKGVINFAEGENSEANKLTYEQPSGFPVVLHAAGKTLSDSTQFQLTQGGFKSAGEAWEEAKEALNGLVLLATELGVGLDAGSLNPGSYSPEKAAPGTSRWSDGLFKECEENSQAKTVAQKIGITVIGQSHQYEEIVSLQFSGSLVERTLRPLGFLQVLVQMTEQRTVLDERTSLALELYSMSFFEHNSRAAFLTLVQMLESLAPKLERSEKVLNFVTQLESLTRKASGEAKIAKELSDKSAYDGILGALSWLKSESISQSIKRLAEESCGDLLFQGLSPSKFIKNCYDTRSALTHSGKTNLSNDEFAIQLHSLRSLCLSVLHHVIGYSPFQIPEEAIGLPFVDSMIQIT